MRYVKQTWNNGVSGGTPISESRLEHIEDGIAYSSDAVGDSAAEIVETSKVTGDTVNRYERRADGSSVIGPGGTTPLKTGAFIVVDMGASTGRQGIRIYGSSSEDALPHLVELYDHLGNPIFVVPADGGPAVLGDSFRVFGQGDVFDPRHKLHHDGSVMLNKGDAAGSVGGVAIGASITAPTRGPDGSAAGTRVGNLMWVDVDGRMRSRRPSGSDDMVGGSNQSFFPPTGGLQGGDFWFNSISKSPNFYDTASWRTLQVAENKRRAVTANYAVAAADLYGMVLHSTAASDVTITLPANDTVDVPLEIKIPWRQYGTGAMTAVAGAGATVVGHGGKVTSNGQYSEGFYTKVDTNTWLVSGNTV